MPDDIYYNDPDTGTFRNMYDTGGTLTKVRESMVSNRTAQGWTADLPTVVVTGTAIAGGVAEAAIVTGGETLIFTLTNGTWDASVLAQLEALTEGNLLNGSASGAGSFDDEISIDFTTDCVRTGDTVLTLTLPAAAGYSIAGDETVTFGLPYSLVSINGIPLTSTAAMVHSPTTFVITNA